MATLLHNLPLPNLGIILEAVQMDTGISLVLVPYRCPWTLSIPDLHINIMLASIAESCPMTLSLGNGVR